MCACMCAAIIIGCNFQFSSFSGVGGPHHALALAVLPTLSSFFFVDFPDMATALGPAHLGLTKKGKSSKDEPEQQE